MKTFLTALLLLVSAPALADPALPFPMPDDDACNQPARLQPLKAAIAEQLRADFDAKGQWAVSFHYSSVWRSDARLSDMTTYFEVIGADQHERSGYVAQVDVDANTCAPTLRKVQKLDLKPSGRCNKERSWLSVHGAVMARMTEIYYGVNNMTVENFSFTEVKRQDGTADLVAYFEQRAPGQMSLPNLAEVMVDPITCRIEMVRSPRLER